MKYFRQMFVCIAIFLIFAAKSLNLSDMKELQVIQSKLKAPKGNYNSFGKYKYRSAEDILEAVKPLLNEENCVLTLSDEIVQVGDRYYIKATCTLVNRDGQKVETSALAREEETKKGLDASQITGTASSYARKYALNGLFCIDDTKDADALNTSAEYTQQPAKMKTQPKGNQVIKAKDDDGLEDAYLIMKPQIETCGSIDELTMIWKKSDERLRMYDPYKTLVASRNRELSNK